MLILEHQIDWPRNRLKLRRPTCLFYMAGIIPSNGRTKQLSQRGKPELLFCSRAVSLDGFETQIQITGNFGRSATPAEQLKNFQFAIAQTFHRRTSGGSTRLAKSQGHPVEN